MVDKAESEVFCSLSFFFWNKNYAKERKNVKHSSLKSVLWDIWFVMITSH